MGPQAIINGKVHGKTLACDDSPREYIPDHNLWDVDGKADCPDDHDHHLGPGWGAPE